VKHEKGEIVPEPQMFFSWNHKVSPFMFGIGKPETVVVNGTWTAPGTIVLWTSAGSEGLFEYTVC
jgi:hypothetical protein